MPSIKLHKKSAEDQLDLVFHALSDRTRRRLLARLAQGDAMITELAEPFAMSFPAISKHLRVLENARLVSRSVNGRVHRCSFVAAPLREAEAWIETYRSFWTGTLGELARYAEKQKIKNVKPVKNK
jgi:DNA-binding transcriptional ArsR family regulator